MQASSSSSPMAQMRTATGGVAAGMSANAAAVSQLMIAAAAGGQSYQYATLGTSPLLTQDSTGIGFPVSIIVVFPFIFEQLNNKTHLKYTVSQKKSHH